MNETPLIIEFRFSLSACGTIRKVMLAAAQDVGRDQQANPGFGYCRRGFQFLMPDRAERWGSHVTHARDNYFLVMK